MEKVTIIRNGETICTAPINETVRNGAYNSMNWHRFSEMIVAELKKQNDVTFEIDKNFASYTFRWREFLYSSVETIHLYVMVMVRHCYSHNPLDMPSQVTAPLFNH